LYVVGLTATPVGSSPRQAAFLCRVMDVKPEFLHTTSSWMSGGSSKLSKHTVMQFHNAVVDRVTQSCIKLPSKKETTFFFSPEIQIENNTRIVNRHNALIEELQLSAEIVREQKIQEECAVAEDTRAFDGAFWRASTMSIQLGFHARLASCGADGMEESDVKYCVYHPSKTMTLAHAFVRSRQKAGKCKVIVYSTSVAMLKILKAYFKKKKDCGKLLMYTGSQDLEERRLTTSTFLNKTIPRGVLFLSSAGAIGLNLCDGCSTMLIFGEIPWNSSDLEQAKGRVHRIGQTEEVEIALLVPRGARFSLHITRFVVAHSPSKSCDRFLLLLCTGSVLEKKIELHQDKKNRLEAAIKDRDFSQFTLSDNWRLKTSLALSMAKVNALGNFSPEVADDATEDDIVSSVSEKTFREQVYETDSDMTEPSDDEEFCQAMKHETDLIKDGDKFRSENNGVHGSRHSNRDDANHSNDNNDDADYGCRSFMDIVGMMTDDDGSGDDDASFNAKKRHMKTKSGCEIHKRSKPCRPSKDRLDRLKHLLESDED
jgi:hypothetical protein